MNESATELPPLPVMFQSIYNQGLRFLAFGGNRMRLRDRLEQGLALILDLLSRMATPLQGRTHLAHIAESVCYDSQLAQVLGEIFTVIGGYGRPEFVAVRAAPCNTSLSKEFIGKRVCWRVDYCRTPGWSGASRWMTQPS